MANEFLFSTLGKYCEYDNPEKTGLLLLDLPTGSGKTYETLKSIYNNYKKSSRKIIFLTELKKNLPHDKVFKSFFEADDEVHLYEKDVIFIDSNVDSIIARLEKTEKWIPDAIKQTNAFKELKNLIRMYHTLIHKSEKSSFDILYASTVKDNIRLTVEPEFREIVRKFLNDAAQETTKTDKIHLIKQNEKLQWIAQLYPAVLSAEKRVFFLSMDKFLAKNTTLVEQSYYFFDKVFLNNALIFIDEFDATKNVVLKHIIRNQLSKRMDIVGLVEQIYSSLQSLTLPEIFKKDYKDGKKAVMSELFQKLNDKVNQLKKDFNINYSIKTIGLTNQKNFLFHDYTYYTIASDNHKYIYLDVDAAEGINKIIFVPEKQEKPTVLAFLKEIRQFVLYFREATSNIAENYYQNKKFLNDKKDIVFTLESALKSFLETLKITGVAQRELMDSFLLREFSPRFWKKNEDVQSPLHRNDLSFYNTGFRYYDFEDSDVHDTKSKIFITDFDTTPERMLLDLAKENFVIGISATARLKSVLCNYDLQYLKDQLGAGKHFYELSEAEQQQFKHNFDAMTQDYVPIHAEFISGDDWFSKLKTLKLSKKAANELRLRLDACDDFVRKRYLKIAIVFEKFVEKEDIKSFLCFLNAHPGTEKQSLDIAILDLFFEALIQKHQKESSFRDGAKGFKVQNAYFILNSTDFEEKKAKIQERLRTGNKLFLITTYRTLGAGQNIQYKLDHFDEWLATGRIKQIKGAPNPDKEKDFDAIYLDKPTHILTNMLGEDKLSAEAVSRRIFELEMLNEAGHFSRKALLSEVEQAFKRTHKARSQIQTDLYRDLYNTEDCRNAVAKEIMQAIGRINRTQFKNNQIYIYADIDIVKEIKFFATSKHICLKEFQALVDKAKQESIGTPNQNGKPQNDINRQLSRCHEWIRKKVTAWDWSEKSVAEWQILREITLRYPTVSKKDYDENPDLEPWQFIYVPMWDSKWERKVTAKKYHFTQQTDYKTVNVNFSGEGKEISEDAVQLPNLMKINELKVYFEQNKYATHFEKNQYIIAPEIFNNIYKGALGEVIGQFLFEKYIIAPNRLQQLPLEIYERFDFKLDHGIFIDFKFWDEDKRYIQNNEMEDDDDFVHKQLQKIDNKINVIKSKGFDFNKVFIINILASSELFKMVVRADGQLIEVPHLIDKTDKNDFKMDQNRLIELQKYLTHSS